MEFLLLVAVAGAILWLMMKSPSGGDEGKGGRLVRKEFVTADGHRVGAGDRVWSQNHTPWLITRIGPMPDGRSDADIWAFMDFDPDYEVPDDMDDTLVMFSVDFPTYVYRRHPADGRCAAMGCGYRPWGAL